MTFFTARGAPPPLARAAALEDSLSSRGPQALRARARLILLTLAIAATTSVGASAQRTVTTGAQNVPLTAVVPVDPRITVGTLPNGLRYYIRTNSSRRAAPSCGWSSTPDRSSRTTTSAGWRTSSSTWPSTARATSRSRTSIAFLQSIGHALRRAPQRQHQLRRDGLPAADSDRQRRRHRPVAAHPGRLGAGRHVRSAGDRQGARRHPRGVAAGPGARARGCRTRSFPSCSRARATPSGCRSASPRSSRRSPTTV